jgi:hypothetical protein
VGVDGEAIAFWDDTCATGPATGAHHRVTQPTRHHSRPDTLTAHIQHLVAQAPPLTDTQRAELRAILQPRKPAKTTVTLALGKPRKTCRFRVHRAVFENAALTLYWRIVCCHRVAVLTTVVLAACRSSGDTRTSGAHSAVSVKAVSAYLHKVTRHNDLQHRPQLERRSLKT